MRALFFCSAACISPVLPFKFLLPFKCSQYQRNLKGNTQKTALKRQNAVRAITCLVIPNSSVRALTSLRRPDQLIKRRYVDAVSANFDALDEKPGGTQCSAAATRMLLVGSRLLRPSFESDEVRTISREHIYATGIPEFDWSSMEPASNITPGMMREAV